MNATTTTILFCALLAVPLCADEFRWGGEPGKHADLFSGDRLVARYVYEPIDESSAERRHDTYKPFWHISGPEGGSFITKGPGGKFTHHRGIFYGFSRCSYRDKEGDWEKGIDTWHCRKAHQIHREMIGQTADGERASLTARIGWIDDFGVEFAAETRGLSFALSESGDLRVDFSSRLEARFPRVKVDGDPQHAGFHFRAANEVATATEKQTYYIRPGSGRGEPGRTINWSEKNDTEQTRNLPWKAMSFVLGGERHSVLYLDRPENPKPARFSERSYGRFGSYFVAEITPDSPLDVAYRLVIRRGEMTVEEIVSEWNRWREPAGGG